MMAEEPNTNCIRNRLISPKQTIITSQPETKSKKSFPPPNKATVVQNDAVAKKRRYFSTVPIRPPQLTRERGSLFIHLLDRRPRQWNRQRRTFLVEQSAPGTRNATRYT